MFRRGSSIARMLRAPFARPWRSPGSLREARDRDHRVGLPAEHHGRASCAAGPQGTRCQISLDDFGTVYSSLSYLHSFPFDKVKIDRSFVANLVADSRSLTLLVGAARLSTDLGLRVTVEGIETLDQLA
jgi:hypothetical protein